MVVHMKRVIVVLAGACGLEEQRAWLGLERMGVEIVPAREWRDVMEATAGQGSGGVVVVQLDALAGLWDPNQGPIIRPPARPPAPRVVCGVRL
jgi:hypothetical protein